MFCSDPGTRLGVVGLECTLDEVIIKRNDMILSLASLLRGGNSTILVTRSLIIINL